MARESILSDTDIRAYVAAVVGAVRAPFGRRGGTGPLAAGQTKVLANNGTKERVLSVTVSRSDFGAPSANVIFTQSDGSASTNDFPVAFTAILVQRFVLRPGEILSVQVVSGAPVFVVGQETF